MTLTKWDQLAGHELFRSLGVEPLSDGFDGAYLTAKAGARTAPLKSFLLDQRIISGLGNIYVCEALHRAGCRRWPPPRR